MPVMKNISKKPKEITFVFADCTKVPSREDINKALASLEGRVKLVESLTSGEQRNYAGILKTNSRGDYVINNGDTNTFNITRCAIAQTRPYCYKMQINAA